MNKYIWAIRDEALYICDEADGKVCGKVAPVRSSATSAPFYKAFAFGHGRLGIYVDQGTAQAALELHLSDPSSTPKPKARKKLKHG